MGRVAVRLLPMDDDLPSARRQPGTGVSDPSEVLLILIAGGDERAFRQLVELHVDRAYALAFRILRNPTDAEDVVQDAFIKAWNLRGKWQFGRAKFSTWLYRVVTNRCLDICRRPKTTDLDNAPELPDGADDALEVLESGEMHGLLDKAMSKLPAQQRIALILSYHDDLSNPEIAQVMDTTISAVESLLKRGRKQLRSNLANVESEIRESFRRT